MERIVKSSYIIFYLKYMNDQEILDLANILYISNVNLPNLRQIIIDSINYMDDIFLHRGFMYTQRCKRFHIQCNTPEWFEIEKITYQQTVEQYMSYLRKFHEQQQLTSNTTYPQNVQAAQSIITTVSQNNTLPNQSLPKKPEYIHHVDNKQIPKLTIKLPPVHVQTPQESITPIQNIIDSETQNLENLYEQMLEEYYSDI